MKTTRRKFIPAAAGGSLALTAMPASDAQVSKKGQHRTGTVVLPQRSIPVLTEADVVVCGAGCAGVGAALAAARWGARTLLVERAPFAGGIITCAGLPYFDGIARKQDHRIVTRGISLELAARMGLCRESDERVKKHNPTIHSVEHFKVLLDRMLSTEPNLRILFHTFAADVVRKSDHIAEVVVANKAGLQRFRPKVVIDTTGDADIAARAQVPLDHSREFMPMSLHFRIGNVTPNPELRQRCRQVLESALKTGELKNFYGPGVGFTFAEDEVYVHATRVVGDAADPVELTRAEIQGRADAMTMVELWKRMVPGFEKSYYISSGPYIGIRETRRIAGVYVLTEQDIQKKREFADAVATGCWYLDLHPTYATSGTANAEPSRLGGLDGFQPTHYDIPYRSLVSRGVDNLLVAGRCHSATRMAASSTRVTATAMAMGQAAGVAAALAVQHKTTPQELDGRKVREALDHANAGPYNGPA
jgi:hypothetical protein